MAKTKAPAKEKAPKPPKAAPAAAEQPEEPKTKGGKSIPPPPEMDPGLGDKTPAYVEWMRDHHPEQFAKQYHNRKTHITDKVVAE